MAEDMYKIVKEGVSKVDTEAGGFNSGHLWKLKSKLTPKFIDYPTAMLNKHGELATTKDEIKNATIDHYISVLKNRPIKDGLEEHRKQREELCNLRIEKARDIVGKFSRTKNSTRKKRESCFMVKSGD